MIKQKMTVVAKAGRVCPRENPREPVITDNAPVLVPASVYYMRLVADGSLREIKVKEPKPHKTGDSK